MMMIESLTLMLLMVESWDVFAALILVAEVATFMMTEAIVKNVIVVFIV